MITNIYIVVHDKPFSTILPSIMFNPTVPAINAAQIILVCRNNTARNKTCKELVIHNIEASLDKYIPVHMHTWDLP